VPGIAPGARAGKTTDPRFDTLIDSWRAGEAPEDFVALTMAVKIVDRFETVHVEQGDGQRLS